MAGERIPITDRTAWLALRQRDVTASTAGALLGVHEYCTPYQLWALKSGRVLADAEETPPMIRGRLLEPVALDLLREHRPQWEITIPGAYYRDADLRLGATPDAFAMDSERHGFSHGVIQIKTVEPSIFRRKWINDGGDVEVPLWIAVQALVEAELTGASWAAVAVMRVGHGLDLDVIDVPLHRPLMDRLRSEVAAFWRSVECSRPPDPDYGRDAEIIAFLNSPDDSLPPLDLSADNHVPELLAERDAIGAQNKVNTERRKAIEAEITAKLAGHTVGLLADGRRITRKMQHRKEFVAKATSFPVIRIIGAAA